MPDTTSKSRGIQSIEVGFGVITVILEAREPLKLTAIAERAGMAASRAHSYLTSFKRVGLIKQDPRSGRYVLGHLALDLGLSAMASLDGGARARDLVDKMQDSGALKGQLFVSVWSENGPVIVSRSEADLDLPFEIRLGQHPSTVQTATGRTFLAFLPRARTQDIVRQELAAEANAPLADLEIDQVYVACEDVRQRGFEIFNSVTIAGLVGIAVPVFDHGNRLQSVITLVNSSLEYGATGARQAAQKMMQIINLPDDKA